MGFFRRLMQGRYGTDHFSLFLMAIYLLLYFTGNITGIILINVLSLPVLAFAMFRILSRNIARRRAENAWFLGLLSPVVRWVKTKHAIRHDRDHRYFKCPGCGQCLRVPKGKGKISITCRACGACFEEKS